MRTLDDVAIGICHSERSEESRCETFHFVQDKLREAILARQRDCFVACGFSQ